MNGNANLLDFLKVIYAMPKIFFKKRSMEIKKLSDSNIYFFLFSFNINKLFI